MANIAFIGLGVMGGPIAGHLAKAGHELTVYNRSIGKAKKWAEAYGGAVAVTPATCHAVSALLEGALGVPVRDHCDRTGRPSCRFELGVKPAGCRRPSP